MGTETMKIEKGNKIEIKPDFDIGTCGYFHDSDLLKIEIIGGFANIPNGSNIIFELSLCQCHLEPKPEHLKAKIIFEQIIKAEFNLHEARYDFEPNYGMFSQIAKIQFIDGHHDNFWLITLHSAGASAGNIRIWCKKVWLEVE